MTANITLFPVPVRLFLILLFTGLQCMQVAGAENSPPKPLPRYRHYYPDAQYHLARSDDRLEMKGMKEQCCVQEDSRGFDLAFIEFDQRGDFWDREQLAIARHQLKKRTAGKKPLLVEYVHGWHHNAQEDEERDVKGFRQLLSYLSKSKFVKDQGYHVFGVYLGWRGEQFRSGHDPIGLANWLPSQLSFYPSKHIGNEVGTMPMISEALFWMVHEARHAPRGARTVLVGHSFGAMVLENAIAQAVASSTAMNVGGGGSVPAPADLVLLLNAAANSLRAKGVTEMLDRMGRSAAPRYIDRDRPLIVSVTSKGDWATGKFYPLGTGLANLTKGFRSYDHLGSNQENTLPTGTTQRDFITTTPGHNRLLRSHSVFVDSEHFAPSSRKAANIADGGSFRIFDDNLRFPLPRENDAGHRAWPFRSLAKGGGECRSEIRVDPEAWMHTGYWIMQTPKELIYDHGDIFNEQALCLYAAIFRIASPSGEAGPRLMQKPDSVSSSESSTRKTR